MGLIVQKFGGTSVADMERLKHVAGIVACAREAGHSVVVVVSAMAGVTNQLVGHIHAAMPVSKNSNALAENDVVLAAGEQVTSGLLALCLQERGIRARSFLSWQIPIHTDDLHTNANVAHIDPHSLQAFLDQGGVPVVAGFQGIYGGSENNQHHAIPKITPSRVTTLGRGGSDMTAVALAHALKADFCDIYTDVAGVYTADPRLVNDARKIDIITFEEMQLLADHGAKVLQPKCVRYAFEKNVRLRVLSSFEAYEKNAQEGTEIVMHTVLKQKLSGIAHSFNEVKISLKTLSPPSPLLSIERIHHAMTREGIHIDGFTQYVTPDDKVHTSFLVTKADLVPTLSLLNTNQQEFGFCEMQVDHDIVKISLVGHGLKDDFSLKSRILKTLNEQHIFAELATVNDMQMTFMAASNHARPLVQLLHDHLIKPHIN